MSPQQLPAMAGRVRRTVFYRYLVARFRPGLPASGHRRLCPPRAPLRPHRRAGRRHFFLRIPMLLQRTLTALLLAPLVILIILFASPGLFAAVATVAFLAAWWEWTQLSGLKSASAHRE